MEPIDPKHIAAINERLAKERISWPLHPNGRLPGRSHLSDAIGYALHDAYDSDGKRIFTTITLSRYDRLRAWLHEHERVITWVMNIGSVILSVMALVLALLAAGCSREQPIARQSPANQQPISSSTDAFTATDEDLDQTVTVRRDALAEWDAKLAADINETAKTNHETIQTLLTENAQLRADMRAAIATDTAQPLRQAETRTAHFPTPAMPTGYPGYHVPTESEAAPVARRVAFAGVAMSGRVPTIVQLSTKQCITVYRVVNNMRTNEVDETFCSPQWRAIRIADPGAAVKFDIIRNPSLSIHRRFYRASFRDTQAVTLPVGVDGPIANVRIIVIGMDASGAEVFMLPETRLVDLPQWVEP